MFFTSPTSNIGPSTASVVMTRSDSRDSTSSATCTYTSYPAYPTSAYAALLNSSPPRSWPTSHALARSDSNTSQSSNHTSTTMRRDSSNSSWMPSPYRSCMSSFGAEPNSYLSDDDLLCPPDSLPIETIPTPEPKKELTTEEQIVLLRELQEKEAERQQQTNDMRRKVVRFASHDVGSKSRRPSTTKRRQTSVRKGSSLLNGPQ